MRSRGVLRGLVAPVLMRLRGAVPGVMQIFEDQVTHQPYALTSAGQLVALGGSGGVSTPVSVANGGTGSTTEAGARQSLGVEIGADVQAYSTFLDDLVALGPPPSPWHGLGWWNDALAWMIVPSPWAKLDLINSDPDTGNGTSTATNLSSQMVSDATTSDGGASSLGRARNANTGTLSDGDAALQSGSGVTPCRRDAGFRITHSFSVSTTSTHRFFALVTATTFTTVSSADDTSGNAMYGLRHLAADGSNFQIVQNAGSGSSTITDSGVAYTADTRYTVSIYTIDSSTVGVEIIVHTGWNTGTIYRFSHSSTIPGATTSLGWGVGIRLTAGVGSSQAWRHYQSSFQFP